MVVATVACRVMTPPVVAVRFVDLQDAACSADVGAACFEAARAALAAAEHPPASPAEAVPHLEEVVRPGCLAMEAEVHSVRETVARLEAALDTAAVDLKTAVVVQPEPVVAARLSDGSVHQVDGLDCQKLLPMRQASLPDLPVWADASFVWLPKAGI